MLFLNESNERNRLYFKKKSNRTRAQGCQKCEKRRGESRIQRFSGA